MEIKKIHVEYNQCGSMNSDSADGMRHIKTLPYLSVVQAVEGTYDIQIGSGETYNTNTGGFFIAPSNIQQTITHNADQTTKYMVCRWVFLKIKINDFYYMDDLYDFPTILPDAYKSEMNRIFDRLFHTDHIFDKYICFYEIAKILSLISIEKKQPIPVDLEHALQFIKDHYKNRITVEQIAEKANLSESHFFSMFKKHIGVSPNAYLNNYRLSIAAEMMIKTDQTITEIADSVGISDSVYFNKLFRKAYQVSPSKYREIYKNSRV